MFCKNCGSELADGTKFCVHCGAAQVAEETPVVPVEEPVYQNSLASEPIVTPVEEPMEPMAAPVYEEPAPVYDVPAPVYEESEPVAEAPKKKKGKKTGVIIAAVLAVVLLIGAGVGVFLYMDNKAKTEAYEEAEELLEAGDYEGALAAFEDLGDFEDAEDRVAELEQQQADYDAALKLLDKHDYEGARKAFKKLGNYRDSEVYVESGIDYHLALYLMDCGANADPAGLAFVEGTPVDDSAEALSLLLYGEASNILAELGEYQDSQDLASECVYEVAIIYLGWGNYDTVLQLMDIMNEEDAQAFNQLFESGAADSTFLADLEEALIVWYDDYENYSIAEEVGMAYEMLAAYEDAYFMDAYLEGLYWQMMNALETQLMSIGSDGYVEDWVLLYQGYADMYYVCDELNDDYGFLNGSGWKDSFVGVYEYYQYYPMVEESLYDQFTGVTAPWSDNGYYYATYYNDTGLSFTLRYYIMFYYGGELLEESDIMDIYVPAGETVEIPLIPPTLSDEEWETWDIVWVFDLDM